MQTCNDSWKDKYPGINIMNLEDAPNKSVLEIVSIRQDKLTNDAMRFGIEPGEYVTIINKLPGGPIVIQKNQQQIAIGRELSKIIEVKIKKPFLS